MLLNPFLLISRLYYSENITYDIKRIIIRIAISLKILSKNIPVHTINTLFAMTKKSWKKLIT